MLKMHRGSTLLSFEREEEEDCDATTQDPNK